MPPALTDQERRALRAEKFKRLLRQDPKAFATHAIKFYGANYKPAACHLLLLDKLHRVAKGEIKRLMVFMPSGSGKTTYLSKIFPAWYLAVNPRANVMQVSHTTDFATKKVSQEVQMLLDQYGGLLGAKPVNYDTADWRVDNGATYKALGVGSAVLGERADLAIIDDPFGGWEDAMSETIRNKVYDWFKNALITRLKPDASVILMHQRVHIDDLAGRLLEEEGDQWEVLFLPAIWDEDEPDELGRSKGESIWPDYYTDDFLARRRAEMTDIGWASMMQQRPTPIGGTLFKPDLIGRIDAAPGDPIKVVRAWDIASTAPKGNNDPDFTVGVKMQRNRNGTWTITDIRRFQGGPEQVRETIINTARDDGPEVYISLPQDPGAAGKYVISDLTKALAGYRVAASPESGDKFTRAMPFAAQVNAGNVNILDGIYIRAFKDELALFPAGKKDDQVDACSRAFGNLIDLGLVAKRPTWGRSTHMTR